MSFEKVKHFIENYCTLSKHPFHGQKIKLIPWQVDWLQRLYGTLKGTERQYNSTQLWIPKKNAKSSILSALSLYHLLEYPGTEGAIIASTNKQAGIIFEEACFMAQANPALNARLWVRPHIKTIEDKRGKSKLSILSSDPHSISGFNLNYLFLDELAEWRASDAYAVWDKTKNATAARTNSLRVVASTAQFELSHIGYEQFCLCQEIIKEPEKNPRLLPVVYSADNELWKEPDEWKRVNPSMGYILRPEEMAEDFASIANSPREEARFKTLRLNIFCGAADAWLSGLVWTACGQKFEEKDFYGERAIIGIDASRSYSLTSYVILVERDGLLYLIPRFFVPADGIEKKEQADGFNYRAQAKRSNLFITAGDVIDFGEILSHVQEDAKRFKITSVAYDPCYLEGVRQVWESKGLRMIKIPQTFGTMTRPVQEFERLVRARKVVHSGDNPLFDYCLANCVLREGANGGLIVDKRKSRKRIDGISAALIGLALHLDNSSRPAMKFVAI